ncbi:MAG: DMT family transporter [Candidatus Heimdallarchaeota archaeon]|nr:DMT family transporter [Candidatus Heimdallarchaeota archaeon]
MAVTDYLGEIAAISGAICFGLSNVLIKSQSGKIKPTAINAIRLTFSAIFYLILILSMGLLKTTFTMNLRTSLFLMFGTLLGVVIGDVIFYFSQQLIGLSRAYPIASSYPLLTYIVGIILGYELYDKFRIQGVLLVILGVYCVTSSTEDKLNNLFLYQKYNLQSILLLSEDEKIERKNKSVKLIKKHKQFIVLGILGAFTTQICWTFGTILMDRGLDVDVSGVSANAFRIITVAPIAILVFGMSNRGKQKSVFSWKGFIIILIAGIFGNTIGGLLYVFALSYTSASTTAAITAAAPLIAAPLSVVFLKEKFSILLFIGTLLTVIGIWLIII